jgi:Mlc titration factor MtfA (ptsG expression regulator)
VGFWRRRRRKKIVERELTPAELSAVVRAVHVWPVLPEPDRKRLVDDIKIFVAEKAFEGAQDLEITEEMRLTVAAAACLLVVRRPPEREEELYPELETIVLYPHPFVVTASVSLGAVTIEGTQVRSGESWSRGLVVLAWDEVARDVRVRGSGHNVVLHELSHQLDAEDGDVDGVPLLASRHAYPRFVAVLEAERAWLEERIAHGLPVDIDAYGAQSPAELFAVTTEAFFERSIPLARRHPALYEALVSAYRIDPAALLEGRDERLGT